MYALYCAYTIFILQERTRPNMVVFLKEISNIILLYGSKNENYGNGAGGEGRTRLPDVYLFLFGNNLFNLSSEFSFCVINLQLP